MLKKKDKERFERKYQQASAVRGKTIDDQSFFVKQT